MFRRFSFCKNKYLNPVKGVESQLMVVIVLYS